MGSRRRDLSSWLLCIAMPGALGAIAASEEGPARVLPLAGTWRFRLDPDNAGVGKQWFTEKLDDAVLLPGTTDTNRKGTFKDEKAVDRLSRVWYWKGPAWYQRDVEIPASWNGKRVSLLLERTKHTRVWVDGTFCGWEDTLSAPQVFDVTRAMTPGRHTLTLLVDNARLPPIGASPHALDERTQTNWNGIIGRMELCATDPVWIDSLQVYPDVDRRRAVLQAVIGNATGGAATGTLTVAGESVNVTAPVRFPPQSTEIHVPGQAQRIELTYRLGAEAPLWDEFNPALIQLQVRLEARAGDAPCRDDRSVRFGLRAFVREGKRLMINGRTAYLRGKLDCAIFPATGHPPMDKAEWIRLLNIAKSYGLNHYRFHSWCPPEAALEAADELGLYLAPELPNKRSNFGAFPESGEAAVWNVDYLQGGETASEKTLSEYLKREGELIFRHYGNHPSFVMFTLGNELGRNEAMYDMVAYFRKIDPRRLYAQGCNNMHWTPSFAEGDDFWVTGKTGKDLPVRGAFFSADYPHGHIDDRPPSTRVDYRESIKDVPAPVISHEIAEFEVTPDFREIPKYTGVLKARNLEIFQERLKIASMLDLSHDFLRASGALSVLCHREDIEAALRTPGFSGFQLLDLQDFSGQGTALVGMLNVFMESKGLITPEAWRQFCCETVPLLRMEKVTWTAAETFEGEIQVAHYGAADIPDARLTWTVGDSAGPAIASGTLGPVTIRQGEVFPVGRIRVPLDRAPSPGKLTVTASVEGTAYLNRYDIWVYPPKVDTRAPAGVLITDRLDATTQKHLDAGGKALLFPRIDELKHSVPGAFQTSFWCWPMFAGGAIKRGIEPPPGTQGFLCDPGHPALAAFPTEFHSNWQWWRIVKNARPIILDDTPPSYRPIVHVIDNFARNHKLGLLFETKAGPGSLLVCASDLPALLEHPEARQLLHSLLRYVDSPAFEPRTALDAGLLKKLLPGERP
jgi:hypothetical protein